MDLKALKAQCTVIRRDIITMLEKAGSGHPGGSLSAVEIMTALYGYKMKNDPARPQMPERDRFVLSKGHAAPCLYATLANFGYFPKSEYDHLRQLCFRVIPTARSAPASRPRPVLWDRAYPSRWAWLSA